MKSSLNDDGQDFSNSYTGLGYLYSLFTKISMEAVEVILRNYVFYNISAADYFEELVTNSYRLGI